METIKNYLESMFRNLPNTPEVLRAKNELLQMMEDKYAELRREGKTENEAVATVISEFGNLDELAASLGIKEFIGKQEEHQRRSVSLDEVKEYISDGISAAILKVIGIILFISCVTPVIFFGDIAGPEFLGIALMFVFIGIGVGMMILSSSRMEQWKFIKQQLCSISPQTTDYVAEEKRKFNTAYNILLITGLILCICCCIPAIVIDDTPVRINGSWGPFCIFAFVAAGVALMVYANSRMKLYKKLLKLNSENTIGGTYTSEKDKEPVYTNKTLRAIMSVYWPSVTCIYLCVSFLTFQWWITWIIWPIASVIQRLIINLNTEN